MERNSRKNGKRITSLMEFVSRAENGERVMYFATKFVLLDIKTYIKIVPQGGHHIDYMVCDEDIKGEKQ